MLCALSLLVMPVPAHAASAPDPPGRADLLAERLARDPIQVTDHEPLAVPPGTAARIRALLAPLKAPVYVVVEPGGLPSSLTGPGSEFIPILRDRLGEDGVYIVAEPSGRGDARQYGGSLPAERAWTTAEMELPFDAGVIAHVERFVEIMTAPDVQKRIEDRRPRPEETEDADEDGPSPSDVRDRKEMTALAGGSALGALPMLVALVVLTRRKAGR